MKLKDRVAVITGAGSGIERRKARILVGTDAKIAALLERIAPVSHWTLLKRGIKA